MVRRSPFYSGSKKIGMTVAVPDQARDHGPVARRQFGEEVDLVAQQREPRRLAARKRRHVTVRHAQHVERETDQQILGVLGAETARHQVLRLDDVGRVLEPGGDVAARIVDGAAGLIGEKIIGAKIGAKALRIVGIAPGGAGEIAHHGAVLGRHLAQIAGPDHAAGTVHVLHDHGRPALDVIGQMLGEQPPLDIGRSPGREVDEHGQPLAFVVGIVGEGRRGEHRQRAQCRGRTTSCVRHVRESPHPLIPADAGIQTLQQPFNGQSLGPRVRGDERVEKPCLHHSLAGQIPDE